MSDTNLAAEAESEVTLPAEGQQEAQEAQQPDVTEAHARRIGWRPKEEWKGDPEKWRPADEFLKRGEEHEGIARENNRRLQEQMDRMAAQMAEMQSGISQFREFASKAEERAFKRAREEVEREMEAAFQTGDAQAFNAARAKLNTVETEYKPEPKPQAQQQVAPEVHAWVQQNPWFNTDPELNEVAQAVHKRIGRDKPGLSLAENLAATRAEIIRRYPEKFENARREAPPPVGEPGGQPPPRKAAARSYENLPPEAKKACDRFVGMKLLTREQYVKDYDWNG